MKKLDRLSQLEREALAAGMTMMTADTTVRIRTLEKKLGLPDDNSLSFDERLTRVETELAAIKHGQ